MSPETEKQVSNVRRFGRYGRAFCVLFAVMLGILLLWSLSNIVAGPTGSGFKVGLGAYTVTGDQMTTIPLKAWSFVVATGTFGILLAGLFHLHRLFSHLARGAIYTKENVWRIRQVGLLALAMAVLQLVLPPISFALVEIGVIDRTLVTPADDGGGVLLLGPTSFGGFIPAALVLLVSWIMDVGRQTTDEAEALRRDADLVI